MRLITICSPLLASLAGCSLIPDYKRPALPVATAYPPGFAETPAAGQEAAADVGWRDFFVDPILADLIAFSLANNRDLRVAIENVEAAEATYRSDRASLFPTIDATASGEFERIPPGGSGLSSPEHINAYALGLSAASYELDVFGKPGKVRISRWWRKWRPNTSPGSPTAIP
jgi:multidrug efflux system outer membrane protein